MVETKLPARFPIEWGKCPTCGHTRTVEQEAIDQAKQDGKLLASAKPVPNSGHPNMCILFDPTMLTVTSVPTITYQDGTCIHCGNIYRRRADLTYSPMKVQMGQPGR